MKFKVTSPYGALEEFRESPHTGIDFAFPENSPVSAIADGIVHLKDFGDINAGKTVLLEMENGRTAIFGHLNKFLVKDGQHVSKDDLLAYSGSTGHSTGSHLHFGLKEGNHFVDPSMYADAVGNMGANEPVTLMDRYNRFSDWVISKQVEFITGNDPQINSDTNQTGEWLFDKIMSGLADLGITIITKIDHVLPEIGAIGTLIAGVSMMILGVRKPFIYYTFFLGGCVLWQIGKTLI